MERIFARGKRSVKNIGEIDSCRFSFFLAEVELLQIHLTLPNTKVIEGALDFIL